MSRASDMTKMLNLIVFSFVVVMGGCIGYSSPPGNVAFDHIETLKDLEGVYQNLGEGGWREKPFYLSMLIWPRRTERDHGIIKTIEIRVNSENALVVKASDGKSIIKEETFIEGKHFKVRSGRIQLNRIGFAFHPKGGDDPFVGPGYESGELGLDRNGQGKYQEISAYAGLIYSFFPMGVLDRKEMRFLKLND
jgi:hypothetical protein